MKPFQKQLLDHLDGDLTNQNNYSIDAPLDIPFQIGAEHPLDYQEPHEPTILKDVPLNSFTVDSLKESIKRKNFENFQKQLNRDYKNLSITDLGTCIRQVYFRWTHADCDIDKFVGYLYSSMMADAGTAVHTYLQSVFPFKFKETWLTLKNPFIKGRIDAYYISEIIEIKTIKVNVFNDPNFTYRPEDLNQVTVCSYLFKNQYNQPVTKMKLLYVPRSLDDFRIVEFDYTPEVEAKAKDILEYGNQFFDYFNKKEVPPINSKYVKTDGCRFCGYERKTCKPQECLSKLEPNVPIIEEVKNVEQNKLIGKTKQTKKSQPKIVDLQ